MAEASTTIRMVYRHFPLSQHKHGQLAARASEAAAAQGKFWDMYQLLFENQESWSPLSDVAVRAVFATYAERLGLDKAAYEAALDSAETKGKVLSQQQDGVRIGVNATPTFFVNGKVLVTSPDYNEFKAAIEAAAQ
jgi:protein-disulfide isomerase